MPCRLSKSQTLAFLILSRSVSWMEDSEQSDLSRETLKQQYRGVKERTSVNRTYTLGSHVMQYGDRGIRRELAGDYLGMHNTGEPGCDSEIVLYSVWLSLGWVGVGGIEDVLLHVLQELQVTLIQQKIPIGNLNVS